MDERTAKLKEIIAAAERGAADDPNNASAILIRSCFRMAEEAVRSSLEEAVFGARLPLVEMQALMDDFCCWGDIAERHFMRSADDEGVCAAGAIFNMIAIALVSGGNDPALSKSVVEASERWRANDARNKRRVKTEPEKEKRRAAIKAVSAAQGVCLVDSDKFALSIVDDVHKALGKPKKRPSTRTIRRDIEAILQEQKR